jgi:hypothetical protein
VHGIISTFCGETNVFVFHFSLYINKIQINCKLGKLACGNFGVGEIQGAQELFPENIQPLESNSGINQMLGIATKGGY